MFRSRILGLVSIVVLAGVACAAPEEEGDSSQAAVTELKAYWADAKKLDLGDLSRVAVGFATDELNNQISGPNIGARFDAPNVFAAAAEPNRVLPDGSEIKALDTVVSGLGARFGENELGTQVNAARLKHLQSGADKYYVESGFALNAGINHGWSFSAGGFGGNGVGTSLGFDAGVALSSRVIIAASDDRVLDVLKAPLASVKQMRGFVYPRSADDIRKMKTGEMFALRGSGKLGGNFGLGAPLLVADPTGSLAYSVVLSAGVSSVISGQLDVQLVRLDGDEVVVDVGVENGKGVSFNAAVTDGFGVKGICEDNERCLRALEFGGKKFDSAKYVEKAIEQRLNQYLTFQVTAGAATNSSRVSLSRFRFHLDGGNKDETSRALEQALKFDLRLAQAIYNRDLGESAPAVVVDFDAVRASTTSTRNFGFELMGMNVYHNAVVKNEGTFVLQTPDGAKNILWDTLQKSGGWFQMQHDLRRTGVAAQTLDAKNPDDFRSEANLFVQTVVSDSHMDDDMIIDNIDGLIGGVAGQKVVDALDTIGNDMQRLVWDACPVEKDDSGKPLYWDEQCNVNLLDAPSDAVCNNPASANLTNPAATQRCQMKALKAQGPGVVDEAIRDLPDQFKALVRDAANTRLALQTVMIHDRDATNGPNASFCLGLRLDDKALDLLTKRTKDQYLASLRDYLANVYADRNLVGKGTSKDDVRGKVDEKWGKQMGKMADEFARRAAAYRLIADAEAQIPRVLRGKRYSSFPLGLRFAVEGQQAGAYEKAILVSPASERAKAAAALFDGLKSVADGISAPLYTEETATFPFLALVPYDNLQVGMDIGADVKSDFWVKRERFLTAGFKSASQTAKGKDVSLISAGMFSLDAIVQGN
ncbi:hypothetical protein AKJ09_02154 [Labilithrix luteola]|uniref:Uncharacterized protein n=1 Tax=Labilithrix luteola TaxID=1391654 RepID=A0A0K1PPM2_9BACT|nr:hypothetical protein [Labilithrix luteola]AKU95490.1 hypothetical protein AKJ09_02154 [Labilithrix luteola]